MIKAYILLYVLKNPIKLLNLFLKLKDYQNINMFRIERKYNCETSSFGRKVRRRNAVMLLGFSCSVADYEETKGFWTS